jgi:hypothetical protein
MLGKLQLLVVFLEHRVFQDLSARVAHRMTGVQEQLHPSSIIPRSSIIFQSDSAFIAEPRQEVILPAATGTTVHHLAAGHSQEQPLGSFEHLEVTHGEASVEQDAHESAKAVGVALGQFYSNFCYNKGHDSDPFLLVSGPNHQQHERHLKRVPGEGSGGRD